jgi:hypothetical protein
VKQTDPGWRGRRLWLLQAEQGRARTTKMYCYGKVALFPVTVTPHRSIGIQQRFTTALYKGSVTEFIRRMITYIHVCTWIYHGDRNPDARYILDISNSHSLAISSRGQFCRQVQLISQVLGYQVMWKKVQKGMGATNQPAMLASLK